MAPLCNTCLWNFPPSALSLLDNEVHVWWTSLEPVTLSEPLLSNTLSVDEKERAASFHFAKDRKYFSLARGLLRVLLGYYTGNEAKQIEFSYGPFGKPALVAKDPDFQLCFNLAHSQGHALYAFTRNRQVGIDLEYIRPLPDIEAIVEGFFSIKERSVFRTLSLDQKITAFFNAWTCKEAVLKAMGDGLTQPLDQIEVSLNPSEPIRLLSLSGKTQEASLPWSLRSLRPTPGYAATLAVEGEGWLLKCWQWEK